MRVDKRLAVSTILVGMSFMAFAEDDVQDMSDPLAVYTQVGAGYTDKGINLKVGQAYDTGSDLTAGMNVIEVKGGWETFLDGEVKTVWITPSIHSDFVISALN